MKTKMTKFKLVKEKTDFARVSIKSSFDSYDCFKSIWEDGIDVYESAYLLVMNRAFNTEGFVRISAGGIAGTVIDVKMIVNYALQAHGSGVILAHNHPSGNRQPSTSDIEITNKIKAALSLLDIKLLDHLILTDEGYYSFADEGMI